MIQLAAGGPSVVKDDEWMAQQHEFAHRHCVVFKGFVDESMLNRISRMLETSQYYGREDVREGGVWSRELTMRDDEPLVTAFVLLLNQPRLFKAIAELTGSKREIRIFEGRCFKRVPNSNHFDSWHNDRQPGRLYGLSINLSQKPVEGGAFQIRSKKTGEILRTVPPSRFGDAHLFRVHRSLEHKVSSVQGTEPRCVYAGWFCAGPDYQDYREMIRKELFARAASIPTPQARWNCIF